MRREQMSIGELTVDHILGAAAPDTGVLGKGDKWVLDPKYGSNGNSGKSVDNALKTLAAAEAAMAADQNDTLDWLGGDTALTLTAQLVWDKDYTHIRGKCSPTRMDHACVVGHSSAPIDGVVQFTGNGCTFANFTLDHTGANTIIINAEITGNDLSYYNVHFKNGNSAALKAVGTTKFVRLNGAENLLFDTCTFGNLAIERTDGAAEVWIGPGTCKVLEFKNCLWIIGLATETDHAMIENEADADINDLLFLDRCTFMCLNATQATAITNTAAITGRIVLRDPMLVNISDIAAEEEEVYVTSYRDTTPGKFEGIAVAPDIT